MEERDKEIEREIAEGKRPGHKDGPSEEQIRGMVETHPVHVERANRERVSKLQAHFPHLVKE